MLKWQFLRLLAKFGLVLGSGDSGLDSSSLTGTIDKARLPSDVVVLTGAAQTLTAAHDKCKIKITHGSAVTVSIASAVAAAGFSCEIIQGGAGAIGFGGTATVSNCDTHTKSKAINAKIYLDCVTAGTMILSGSTQA